MPILGIHSKNIFNPSFCGALQHKLSKRLYTKDELNKILEDYNGDERYAGSLPPSWVKSFSPDEAGAKTQEAFKIFGEFAESVSGFEENRHIFEERKLRELEFEIAALRGKFVPNNIIEKKWEENDKYLRKLTNESDEDDYIEFCEDLSLKLSNLLNKKCEVEYLNSGAYGIVFTISADDEKYSLKVYKPAPRELKCNGATVEPANAIYLNRVMKPERRAKFYCGKIASDNENDGFMLTQYIEPQVCDMQKMNAVKKWIYNADMLSNRFTFTDVKSSDPFNGNFINGALVDFGGVEFTCKNAKEYKLMKKLHKAIKSADTEAIREIKIKYGGSKEFTDCLNRLFSYAGLLSDENRMMLYGDLYSKPTEKTIKGFKEFGINLAALYDDI